MDFQTVYFKKPGPENTDETLRLAGEWPDRLGIRTILTAGTSGATGVRAVGRFAGRPANVSRFFDLRIRGILCKPWDF